MKKIQQAILAAAIAGIIGCDGSEVKSNVGASANNTSASSESTGSDDNSSENNESSNSGNSNQDSDDSNSANSNSGNSNSEDASSEQSTTEVSLLGADWRYESWISPCPDARAVFESTQFLSSDSLTINSYARNDGEVVESFSCKNLTVRKHPVISVAGANATDPVDKNELREMLTDWTSFYYGAPESNIDIDLITFTEDELAYQATISGYGQSFDENVTLTRLED